MKPLCLLLASLLLGSLLHAGEPAPLGAEARAFLADYERIRAALAADDLPAARAAAADQPAAQPIAAATDLTTARKAFKQLSAQAVALARGQPGYFIAHCSMFPGGADWVQTTAELANPYWGKSMPHCGTLVK